MCSAQRKSPPQGENVSPHDGKVNVQGVKEAANGRNGRISLTLYLCVLAGGIEKTFHINMASLTAKIGYLHQYPAMTFSVAI